MRVRGRGVPAGGKHAAGDLLVTVNVTIPKKLNKEQKLAVEKLAVALERRGSEWLSDIHSTPST